MLKKIGEIHHALAMEKNVDDHIKSLNRKMSSKQR